MKDRRTVEEERERTGKSKNPISSSILVNGRDKTTIDFL